MGYNSKIKAIRFVWIGLISSFAFMELKGQLVMDGNQAGTILAEAPFHPEDQPGLSRSLELNVQNTSTNDRLTSHVLKITNRSTEPFNGVVRIEMPGDVRSLSLEETVISVAPGDSSFVSYRLVVNKEALAGRKTIGYTLLDETGNKVMHREAFIDIVRREQIHLQADDAPVMMVNPEDSVRVSVTINNRGNTREEVTLVFNVPNLRDAPAFTEVKVVMEPMEQRRFTRSFLASNNLLSSGQFTVYVTAMKGPEKTIFGSRNITVQNVFSSRNYVDILPTRSRPPGQGSTDNSLTLSYRQYNAASNMLQLQGGGYMNLPAGYLHLKGNLYKYSSSSTPLVTNTSLMYKLYENEFTVGNVNEQMELPLYGRGAKVLLSDLAKSKTLTFGAIDQNFNLIDSRPWFADYYSFYVQGTVGTNNTRRSTKAAYVYQRNPYEKAEYNVGSLQWRRLVGTNWEIQLDGHGALSIYDHLKGSKVTGAGEFRYRGDLPSDISVNGAGYYSDPYFPGTRKGTLSLTQGINKRFKNDVYTSGSITYNRVEPKSYTYSYSYSSENTYANAALSLPRWEQFSTSFFYRYQGESSSSYDSFTGEGIERNARMVSHRLGGQWGWQSPNVQHSLYGTLEGGGSSNPLGGKAFSQVKSTLKYSWKWLTADLSYQRGAYYLYEYMMARQQGKAFYRFISSASINKNISKKLSLTSSMNFTRDAFQGNVPSMNLTANYFLKDNLTLFTNAYWYQYRFVNRSNIFNIQVGLTWNFSKTQPLSGKKSTVVARVYYDNNANSQYDEEDKLAKDYLLNLNEKTFISDEKGEIRYKLVPYGEYTLRPARASRWFFNRKKVVVDGARTVINIPLTQSGTLRGGIHYETGEHSMEVALKYEGIRVIVTGVTDKTFTRTLITDARGQFLVFLPMGEYTLTLDKNTLAEHTLYEEPDRVFTIEAGKVNEMEPLAIQVQSRRINVKRF